MRYPYIAFHPELTIQPVFPSLMGEPYILDLSSDSPLLSLPGAEDQRIFQKILDQEMSGYSWGLSSYLEERRMLLSDCPQMMREKRFYHLGLDVIVPARSPLHAPLNATVYDSGYEEGKGNYGGYVTLHHHDIPGEPFYSVFGHLKRDSLPQPGTVLRAGEEFAETGEFEENGGWFYHTHIQILTGKGMKEGMQFKGYCSESMLKHIESLCPHPLALFTISASVHL
ncbi:MAG: peptidoglycan DD-metalloendopeptidase family protein [Sphaerochaetaceae bacterium]|nr:peptidoglycan DD-metalloendopeptidase family protein [Sphaerochaetaceae bacterium]